MGHTWENTWDIHGTVMLIKRTRMDIEPSRMGCHGTIIRFSQLFGVLFRYRVLPRQMFWSWVKWMLMILYHFISIYLRAHQLNIRFRGQWGVIVFTQHEDLLNIRTQQDTKRLGWMYRRDHTVGVCGCERIRYKQCIRQWKVDEMRTSVARI